jgi:signal transduction histidine kinase
MTREGRIERVQTVSELVSLESVDGRMISLLRLILALSALIIIYIDPSEPDRFVVITYAALVVYSAYSGLLFLLALRHSQNLPFKIAHWIDVGCYLVLIALSSGTNSIFFFFFFFAILVASFRGGFKSGLQVTVASTVLFTVIGFVTSPPKPAFELNRFLLRSIYLLVLGYMMAYWGGAEITLKRRLSLLKDVTASANPRFGIEHMLSSVIKKLRAFYDAELSLLVYSDLPASEYRLLRADRSNVEAVGMTERIPQMLAQLLLAFPQDLAVVYKGRRWPFGNSYYYGFDISKRQRIDAGREEAVSLAAQFECESFVSIPARFHDKAAGRIYLASRRYIFTTSDVEFLTQIFEQVAPILDRIRLLERLASSAAEQERQRLARDIHDSVIQPYVGLQYKLAAIRNKAGTEGSELAQDLERLYQVTTNEIGHLRGFVGGLKELEGPQDDLICALRRFAQQFAESYNIDVQVECNGVVNVRHRLAAEVIAIVQEGLSNIRKHTSAKSGTILLERADKYLSIHIENDNPTAGDAPPHFQPGSITERAQDLGGRAFVEANRTGRTVVTVEIPL